MKRTVTLPTRLLALVLVAGLSASGCLATEEGPELPPVESMQLDLAAFTGALSADKADDPSDAGTTSKANFQNAAFRVGLLNLAIGAALIPPTLVFAAAVNTQPRFEQGEWIWEYSVTAGGQTFAAHLTGWFEGHLRTGTTLELEMRVTCTGCAVPTEDFLWYAGSFDTAGAYGYWQFFHPEIAQDDQTFVRIDYVVSGDRERSLTFENLRSDGHPDAGDLIDYTLSGDLLTLLVHDASASLDYSAAADLATGEGWLQVPGYLGGAQACWDGEQYDVACE